MRIITILSAVVLLLAASVTPVAAHGCHTGRNSTAFHSLVFTAVSTSSDNVLTHVRAKSRPANTLHFGGSHPRTGIIMKSMTGHGRAELHRVKGTTNDVWQAYFYRDNNVLAMSDSGVLDPNKAYTFEISYYKSGLLFFVDFRISGGLKMRWSSFPQSWTPRWAEIFGRTYNLNDQFFGGYNAKWRWEDAAYGRNFFNLPWPSTATLVSSASHAKGAVQLGLYTMWDRDCPF